MARRKLDYAALERDLRDAREAATKVRYIDGDGGASVGDGVTIQLPRAIYAKVQAAAEAAGCFAQRRHLAGSFSITPIGLPFVQGYERTARAEAMAEVLRARGWDAGPYYFMN